MATVKHTFLPEEVQFLATLFPAYSKVNGTNFPVSGLAFDAAADEFAYWKFKAQNYGSGNLGIFNQRFSDLLHLKIFTLPKTN